MPTSVIGGLGAPRRPAILLFSTPPSSQKDAIVKGGGWKHGRGGKGNSKREQARKKEKLLH